MKFEVVLTERKEPPANPFSIGLINQLSQVRRAVIEANSAAEVRKYFKDAVARDLPNVRGFDLTSVTKVGDDHV